MAVRLAKKSDLGCVLVASAHIEDQLGKMLDAYFVSAAKFVGIAINESALEAVMHGDNAFIRDFSVRTRLAYALGLISKNTKETLGVFRRELRNKFAHGSSDDHDIADRLLNRITKELDEDRRATYRHVADLLGEKLMNSRHRFTFYVLMIWTELYRDTTKLTMSVKSSPVDS